MADPRQLQAMRSKLSMVFQHFNLWSHMTVLENIIECPMNVLGISRSEALERARHYLSKVGLPTRMPAKYPCTCPADNNSAWRSPARWPWSPK